MNLQEILTKRDELRQAYEVAEQNTPYAKTNRKISKVEKQIKKLKEKLNTLQAKAEKQSKKHYKLLEPLPTGYSLTTLDLIAQELVRRNPQFKSYYVIGTFGCTCESSIWFYEDELGYTSDLERIRASLTFWSDDKVWTGEETDKYPEGSIGWMNGENKVMVNVTSIEQLDELLQKSIKEHKEKVVA